LIYNTGWAFSIWGIIFVGEILGLLVLWVDESSAKEFSSILVPFTYACILQSIWCVFFSREQMFLSAMALTGIYIYMYIYIYIYIYIYTYIDI
jgi:tryptophan-rich sensory protein